MNDLSRSTFLFLVILLLSPSFLCAEVNPVDEPNVIRDLTYGDHIIGNGSEQTLDLYLPDTKNQRAVVIFVHSGGWAFGDKGTTLHKPAFFMAHDMAFISMNYRLRWDYSIYDQASDVASVVKWVKDNGDQYGLDASRVVLLGAEAGAHLVSLVGTDERYLKAVGLSFANLSCVAAVDTPAYDLQSHIETTASFLQARHLSLIFSSDPAVWEAASPASYVKPGKFIPSFALMYTLGDEAIKLQTLAFAKKLSTAEGGVIIIPAVPGEDGSAETILGTPGDGATLALITFINARI